LCVRVCCFTAKAGREGDERVPARVRMSRRKTLGEVGPFNGGRERIVWHFFAQTL
jgi:hypothetical protein